MAVEIPVYVDIQGAFDRAVKEIPQEMPKLEKVLSRYALNMKIDLGGGNMNTVRNLLTDTTMTAEELEHALRRVRKAFDDAVVKGASKSKTSATVNNLAKAYGLLEQRVKGFYNANNVSAMRLEDTIAKINFKIVELKTKLAGLAPGTDQFNKFNYELKIQQQRLAEVTRQQLLYKAGVDASNKSLTKQGGIVKQLTGYFGGLYAAHAVLRFVRQVHDVTGELEYQRVALGHLLGDMQFGNELFGQIIEAAKESPFRIKDLVTYTKQLAAYRIEEENLYDTTMRLADISAGLGVDMNRLILAYGQVRAASVLRGQELRQFTEAGIPLVDELAKKFTKLKGEMVTTADVFKLISERAVPFEYIKEIFEDLTNAGGMFYKMQEEQAKTLQGRWEKLKDAYDQALMSLGEDNTFQSWNDTVLDVLNGVAKNLKGIVRVLNAASVGWIAYKVATNNAVRSLVALVGANAKAIVGLSKMFGATGTLRIGLVALRRAWDSFTVAVSKNWVGIALSALATLATYFLTFKGKAKDATDAISDMQKAIEKMKDANKEFEYSKGLISGYEELAKKTDRTANENERLATTMAELKRLYPEITGKIDDENLSLEKQMELLGSVSEKKHADAVEEAKKRLVTQDELIRKYEDEAAAAKVAKDAAEQRLREAKAAEKAGPIPLEQRYGPGTYASAKDLADATSEAAVAAKQAEEAYDKIAERLAVAKNEAEELQNIIDPKRETKNWQQWAVELKSVQDKMLEVGDTPVFDDKTLGEFTSVYKFAQKLKKEWTDLKESIKGMRREYDAMTDKQSHAAQALNREIEKGEKTFSIAEAWRVLLGLDFSNTTNAYVQDPFIKQMENRMKFMKDFQKGYEDLSKYLAHDTALDKELSFMRDRGLSLGIDESEQKRAAKDLSRWYQDTIDSTFEYLKKEKGVSGEMSDFLSKQITGSTNRDKMLRDFQSMMQSLFDAKTDFDVSQKKKEIEDALKRLSNEIKQSEQAKNFYNDILGLSGDQTLAANMTMEIYGTVGDDFKKQIQKELSGTFAALTPEEADKVSDVLKKSIESGDIKALMAHINELPEKMAEAVRKAADATEKYNADIAKSYARLLMQFDELKQQEVDITNKANKEKLDLEEGLELRIAAMRAQNATEEEIEAERARVRMAKYNIDADTKARLNALSSQYRLFFNTVDVISIESARKIAAEQKKLLADQLAAQKITFKEYQKEIKAINDHLKKYENKKGYFLTWITEGLDGLLDKIREEADSLNGIIPTLTRENFKDGIFTPNEETEEFLTRYDKLLNKGLFSKIFKKDPQITLKHKIELAATQAYNQAKAGGSPSDVAEAKAMAAGLEALGGAAEEMGGAAAEGAEAAAWIEFWIKNAYQTIKGLDDRITKGGEEEASEIMNFFAGPLRYIAGKLGIWDKGDETWDKLAAVNTHAMDFVEAMKNGDFGNALFAVYDALYDLWGPNQRKIKREIKEQSNLIGDLEYEYSRLEVAVQKAFGSDYISDYNQQLTVLQAKAEAYRKQAELERSKGKKADEDTAKGYEKSARDVEDQIADMQSQLSEFFSGTDVTSAAKDFAQAWIDAYQEFGSTTDAMKEKFNDMIEEMVINSLAARLVQGILKPIFDQIDEAAQDGALTAQEIASISAMVPDAMAQIDAGMTGMVNELTAAGVNLRQQAGTFTGISRDIASASEESINGLAAGINTQNFYISHIDQNVALILSVLTGGTTTPQASVTGQVADPYKDEMLKYAAYMPTIDQNLADLLAEVKKVIKPKGVAAQHYVATNL